MKLKKKKYKKAIFEENEIRMTVIMKKLGIGTWNVIEIKGKKKPQVFPKNW